MVDGQQQVDNGIGQWGTEQFLILNRTYKKIKNFETSNIGTARFYQNGKLIGKVSLEILEKTEKLSFFELFVNILKSIF